jgi:hypothetical protein
LKTKRLLIEIHLDQSISKSDLHLRYLLVDTLESRGIGEVTDETSSSNMLEVVINVLEENHIQSIPELLISLGFNDFNIIDISEDDDE